MNPIDRQRIYVPGHADYVSPVFAYNNREPLPRSKRFSLGEWVEEIDNPTEWGQVVGIEDDGHFITYRKDLGEMYQDTSTHATAFRRTRKRYSKRAK